MIEMDCKKWNEKIQNNFNDAAYRYLEHSNIQKFFAKKIVYLIIIIFKVNIMKSYHIPTFYGI